ncbi:hypothetical protein ACIOJD_26520 [Streptomyces sp. NPDC088116]|uniref:hypothetical protein n=1 Tax=Streptomyces sp. NPDC088116 TaxID=3365825 RepID=UPI0038099855
MSHPMASPGYGKRSTPGQLPRTATDFAHLPPREAAVAAFIDRLPDGTDMSVKALAKLLPYGQCALRTALRHIQTAGHLRRGREHLTGSGSALWVTRTWFSRTARGNDWWAAFTSGAVPDESAGDVRDGSSGTVPDGTAPSPRPPTQAPAPTRSRAFILLAALGRSVPAMSLSAADCVALEPLAAAWFERGATEKDVLNALTAGLPVPVHHAASLARSRLTSKLPPEPIRVPRPALRVLECAKCGVPGRPEALLDGECAPCRGEPAPAPRTTALPPTQVRTLAAEARAAVRPVVRPPERTRV